MYDFVHSLLLLRLTPCLTSLLSVHCLSRCYNCGGLDHHAKECKLPPQPKKCHFCQSVAHMVAQCPLKAQQSSPGSQGKPSPQRGEEEEEQNHSPPPAPPTEADEWISLVDGVKQNRKCWTPIKTSHPLETNNAKRIYYELYYVPTDAVFLELPQVLRIRDIANEDC